MTSAGTKPQIVAVEPLLVNGRDAARLLSISSRTFRRLDSAGAVPLPVRIGRSKRWAVADLRSWCCSGCPSRQVWQQRRFRENVA